MNKSRNILYPRSIISFLHQTDIVNKSAAKCSLRLLNAADVLVIILMKGGKTCTSCVQMRLRRSQRIGADSTDVCSTSTGANRYFISAHSVIYACVCGSERNVLIKADKELKRIRGPNQSKLCMPLIRSRNFSDSLHYEYVKQTYVKTGIKFTFVKSRPLTRTIMH